MATYPGMLVGEGIHQLEEERENSGKEVTIEMTEKQA